MVIPSLTPHKAEDSLLPHGIHSCDQQELYERFVTDFPRSSQRKKIAAGFFKLRSACAEHGVSATQWVDGSFVTGKPDPEDVDVVAFILSASLNSLAEEAKAFLETLHDGGATMRKYLTHHFVVPVYPDHDARFPAFVATTRYWRKWWGRTRQGTPKGFLSMTTGNPDMAPKVF